MTGPVAFGRAHDHAEPLLAELALGTLDADLRPDVEEHVAECAACRLQLAELSSGVAALEVAGLDALGPGAPVTPTPAARESLLDAVRRTPQLPAPGRPAPVRAPRTRPRRRWLRPGVLVGGVAATALGACVVVLGLAVADRGDRIDQLERRLDTARGDQVPALRGASISDLDVAGPFGDARAQVVLKRDAGIVTFRDVPAPPGGMVWQVWIIDTDEHISSIGVIEAQRKLAILDIDGVDPDDVERIIVTTEPAGGSDEPTADEVADVTV